MSRILPKPIRLLTAADVRRCLSVSECIDLLERAFRLAAPGRAASFVGGVKTTNGKFHMKAALADLERPLFAAKLNANFPDNPRTNGLPTIQGVLILSDAENGCPLGIMDSGAITAIRTAAASGLVARKVASRQAKTLALVGCGVQAFMHLGAMRAVRPIECVRAYDVDRDAARRMVDFARDQGIDDANVTPDVRSCVEEADIVVTCTTSTKPFLAADHVRDGSVVAAVGVDNPEKSEITPALLSRAAVIVDDLEQCAEMGDLHHALDARAMQKSDVWSTLADVVRDSPAAPRDRPIVFDSTGIPLEDVAAAAGAYARAIRDDVGATFDLS